MYKDIREFYQLKEAEDKIKEEALKFKKKKNASRLKRTSIMME